VQRGTKKIDFSHNPFSMPQGGSKALRVAGSAHDQGVSVRHRLQRRGAVVGRDPQPLAEIMYKAFEIAGYTREDVERAFGGMLNAFKFGAPPHGGSAPGIDRIVMLLADEPNIPRGDRVPAEPESAGPAHAGAGRPSRRSGAGSCI
jgi:aspartyl-tRNA synthetase